MFNLENETFIYFSLLIAVLSMVFYAIDKFSMVFKSIVILTFLLIFFSIFPFIGKDGENLLNPQNILSGFSNTSLITVISLLILGQGVVNTRVLDGFISNFLQYFPNNSQIVIIVSLIFVLTIQIFDPFRGNAAHLIHSIKHFDTNKLENDWIANQAHHLPVFVQFNYFLIKFFSSKVIYFIHGFLLALCALYLFLISKNLFPKLETRNLSIIWFALFTILFHENSFFSGVAGQSVIDIGYQPASFGILFFIGIYRNRLSFSNYWLNSLCLFLVLLYNH